MNETFFPLFVNLTEKKILIVGAGSVARRRLDTLSSFCNDITVIAPNASDITGEGIISSGSLTLINEKFHPGHVTCMQYDYVLAATNDIQVNHEIVLICRQLKTPVNNASCHDDCDFYFPAIVQKDNLTIGISSSGKDTAKVRTFAKFLRELFGKDTYK